MADNRFINVKYKTLPITEVNVTGVFRLSGVQNAIKTMFSSALPMTARAIQLRDKNKKRITKWAEFDPLSAGYFEEGCYEDIFDLLVAGAEEGIKHFAITGTPGIGKSFFFTCILYRLTKDRSKNTSRLRSSSWKPTRIICQTAAIKHACFDLENQSVHRVTEEEAENFVRQSETLYVIDGHDSPSLLSTCVSVFIAAPGSSDYQQFLKHHHLLECCFPVWTKDELTACRKQCNSNILEEMMLERLRIYGGMARAIFASDLSLPPADMEAALADPIAVARIRNLGVHRGLKGRVHLLLLMIVSDDGQYQFSHAAFASKYVFDQLWEKHPQQMISNLQDMLRERCTEISQPLFEAYRHRVLSSGGI